MKGITTQEGRETLKYEPDQYPGSSRGHGQVQDGSRQRGRRQPQAGLQRRPHLPPGGLRRRPDGQEDDRRLQDNRQQVISSKSPKNSAVAFRCGGAFYAKSYFIFPKRNVS